MKTRRIIADIIIILIGLFPLVDIILNQFGIKEYNIGSNFGYNNGSAFLFTFYSTINPILFTIAFMLKFHKFFLFFPVFTYSSDFYWMIGDQSNNLDLSRVYGFLTACAFIVIAILFNKYSKEEISKDKKISYLEKMLDLSYTIIKKRNEV